MASSTRAKAVGARVVVVDDDEDNREVVRLSLEHEGFSVATFERGGDAIAFVHAEDVHVVLLDLRLAGESGELVAQRLRADPATAHVALVAMSGLVEPEWGAARPFDAYLRKPIAFDELPDLCRSLAAVSKRARTRRRRAR